MPTYEYIGDSPVVFINLSVDGHTWEPSKGDQITVDEPIEHADLDLVIPDQEMAEPAKKIAAVSEPAIKESPVTDDEQEEN